MLIVVGHDLNLSGGTPRLTRLPGGYRLGDKAGDRAAALDDLNNFVGTEPGDELAETGLGFLERYDGHRHSPQVSSLPDLHYTWTAGPRVRLPPHSESTSRRL